MSDSEPPSSGDSQQRIGLWDAVSIIVGIVVGTSIFKTPQMIFGNVEHAWQGMLLWAFGGLLSLVGALCYAELATTYPRLGGDYVYLTRAFGRWVGFLFGWAQLTVILTGSIGVMAYAFADYATGLWLDEPEPHHGALMAAGSVIVLSAMNLLGVASGKTTQNLLTLCKVIGLGGIMVAGMAWGGGALRSEVPVEGLSIGFAMIFVLYAYGGWNDAAFVAAEVRDPRRNLPRALILGTLGITLIYLLVNAAYLWGLGFAGVRASSAPAADVLELALGERGEKGMRVLVMISALGAINGLILTGSRLFVTFGAEHTIFGRLGQWDPRRGTPGWAIVVQAVIALLLIGAVGTETGRGSIDLVLQSVRLAPLPWSQYYGGFETLVAGTAPVFWIFFLLTGLSLFALREVDRDLPRPFSVPLYPFLPFIFCLTSIFMLDASLRYAGWLALLGLVPLTLGVPLYLVSGYKKPPAELPGEKPN